MGHIKKGLIVAKKDDTGTPVVVLSDMAKRDWVKENTFLEHYTKSLKGYYKDGKYLGYIFSDKEEEFPVDLLEEIKDKFVYWYKMQGGEEKSPQAFVKLVLRRTKEGKSSSAIAKEIVETWEIEDNDSQTLKVAQGLVDAIRRRSSLGLFFRIASSAGEGLNESVVAKIGGVDQKLYNIVEGHISSLQGFSDQEKTEIKAVALDIRGMWEELEYKASAGILDIHRNGDGIKFYLGECLLPGEREKVLADVRYFQHLVITKEPRTASQFAEWIIAWEDIADFTIRKENMGQGDVKRCGLATEFRKFAPEIERAFKAVSLDIEKFRDETLAKGVPVKRAIEIVAKRADELIKTELDKQLKPSNRLRNYLELPLPDVLADIVEVNDVDYDPSIESSKRKAELLDQHTGLAMVGDRQFGGGEERSAVADAFQGQGTPYFSWVLGDASARKKHGVVASYGSCVAYSLAAYRREATKYLQSVPYKENKQPFASLYDKWGKGITDAVLYDTEGNYANSAGQVARGLVIAGRLPVRLSFGSLAGAVDVGLAFSSVQVTDLFHSLALNGYIPKRFIKDVDKDVLISGLKNIEGPDVQDSEEESEDIAGTRKPLEALPFPSQQRIFFPAYAFYEKFEMTRCSWPKGNARELMDIMALKALKPVYWAGWSIAKRFNFRFAIGGLNPLFNNLFIPGIGPIGAHSESLVGAYVTVFLRWLRGNLRIAGKVFNTQMNFFRGLQFKSLIVHWLTYVAKTCLMVMPILYIHLDIPSVIIKMDPKHFATFGLLVASNTLGLTAAYLISMWAVSSFNKGNRGETGKGLALDYVGLGKATKSAYEGIVLRVSRAFKISSKGGEAVDRLPLRDMPLEILLFSLNFLALYSSMHYFFVNNGDPSMFGATIWSTINLGFLGYGLRKFNFGVYNEAPWAGDVKALWDSIRGPRIRASVPTGYIYDSLKDEGSREERIDGDEGWEREMS